MKLKEIRINNDLTHYSISKLLNVSRVTYSLWESQKEIIPLRRLNEFCKIFNYSVDYVLGFTKTPIYKNYNPEIDLNKCAIRLKRIRLLNNHTQEFLSHKFGINRSLLSKYERSAGLITTTFLIEYVKLYHISADYLLGHIDDIIYLKAKKTPKVLSS